VRYLFLGDHADCLASGRPVAPGDQPLPASAITPDEQPDKDMLEQRILIPVGDSELGDIADKSIDAIVKWVGDDDQRRQEALAAETARGDDARSTLIEKLTTKETT
jgi:hypothetical protein